MDWITLVSLYCHCRCGRTHQTACERRPRYDRHSCTNRLLWYYPMLVTVHSIIITPLTTTGTLTVYVDRLKRVYQNPPTTWLPLPNCKHIKLAVTKEKGMRHGREPDAQIECRVRGEIEPLMDSKVPVDMDSIFDDGTFENARRPMVILVEGALGSGKTSLAYHYCQKWAEGNLSMFDVVALVYLRHPAVHSAGLDLTLHQLLLLACASDGEKEIEDIVGKVVRTCQEWLEIASVTRWVGWGTGLPSKSSRSKLPSRQFLPRQTPSFCFIQHYHPHHLSTRLLTGPTQQSQC